jgi:hypothetical protein
MKTYWIQGTAPHLLNLGTRRRCVISCTTCPSLPSVTHLAIRCVSPKADFDNLSYHKNIQEYTFTLLQAHLSHLNLERIAMTRTGTVLLLWAGMAQSV